MILSIFITTLNALCLKLVYQDHKDLSPTIMIFAKSAIGLIVLVILANKNLFMRMALPGADTKFLLVRVVMMSMSLGCLTYVCKYFDMVYIGIVSNFVPMLNVLLSYIFLGEILPGYVKVVVLVAFVGVMIISYGKYE